MSIVRDAPADELVVTARIGEPSGDPIPRAILRIYLDGAQGFEFEAAARGDGTAPLRVSDDAIAFAKSAIPDFSGRFVVAFEGAYDAQHVDERRPVGTVYCDAEITGPIPHAS